MRKVSWKAEVNRHASNGDDDARQMRVQANGRLGRQPPVLVFLVPSLQPVRRKEGNPSVVVPSVKFERFVVHDRGNRRVVKRPLLAPIRLLVAQPFNFRGFRRRHLRLACPCKMVHHGLQVGVPWVLFC